MHKTNTITNPNPNTKTNHNSMLFFLLLADFIHEISTGELAAFRQCCCYACSACPGVSFGLHWVIRLGSPTDWVYLAAYFDELGVEFLVHAMVTHCNASNLMLDILKPDITWWTICIRVPHCKFWMGLSPVPRDLHPCAAVHISR